MDSVFAWVAHYGYAGLFGLLVLGIVGLPVPDETLLVFCGYLISQRRLLPFPTFLAGFGGSACGISISYFIGRTLGRGAANRYGKYIGLTAARLDRVHRWFQYVGDWLLAIGYFIPGVRHFTAIVAGMSDLEFGTFAKFAYTGAAVWVASFLYIGYIVGENWQAALQLVHRYTLVFATAAMALALIAWGVHQKRSR